jgi:alpha-D-ribose 1-methylphosphonate 5-triphosphate synthase subunit PhnG
MTYNTSSGDSSARRTWLAVLARASLPELESKRMLLGALPAVQQVRPPEVGMLMLRGRVGGTGDPFNLGEASVVRCAVRLGSGALGVAYALGRDKRRAELAALFDALLQDPAWHDELQRMLIKPLQALQTQVRDSRRREVAPSKVEFFTLVRGDA